MKKKVIIRESSSALVWNIVKVIIALGFLGTLWYGGTHDWFRFGAQNAGNQTAPNATTVYNVTNITIINGTITANESAQYSVNLSVKPKTICVGEETTGEIETNIPNGLCSIFFNANGNGWFVYKNIQLSSKGKYTEEKEINAAGYAMFRIICCDLEKNCKISDSARVDVDVCEEPVDCSKVCEDYDHHENLNETEDDDCESYAYSKCADGFQNALATDECCCWTCNEQEEEEENDTGCTDTDGGNNLLVKGTCTAGAFSATDSCPVDLGPWINENFCGGWGGCSGVSAKCYDGAGFCHNGMCIANTQDLDGDGFTDYEEYLQGTNPNDPNSHPVAH